MQKLPRGRTLALSSMLAATLLAVFQLPALAGCLDTQFTKSIDEDGGLLSPMDVFVVNSCDKPFWVIICSTDKYTSKWVLHSEGRVNPNDRRFWQTYKTDKELGAAGYGFNSLGCEMPFGSDDKPHCAQGDICGGLTN